jgi:tetratricopeptide (TPR) repeat protein
MSIIEHDRTPEYWNDLAEHLRREVDATTDRATADVLRIALFRLLAEQLDRDREAATELDALIEEGGKTLEGDLPWEELRFAMGRDSKSRARALERLSRPAQEQAIRTASLLFLSRLLAAQLADPAGAQQNLAAALTLEPDNRLGLWMLLLDELESRGDAAAASALDRLRELTGDRALRAALTLDLAAIRRRQGADPDEVATLHEEVLAFDVPDWWLLNETARECAEIGRHDLAVRAWERLAQATVEPPPAVAAGRPPGLGFQGIERGNQAAAAAWWMSALLRERRFDDIQGALVAMENAADHLPGSALLETECARLRRATGLAGAAAAEIDAPQLLPVERCALALAAGFAGRVREICGERVSLAGSPLLEALVAVSGSADDRPLDAGDRERDPASWLAANPGHPEARDVAARLISAGAASPLAWLVDAEGSTDRPWWVERERDAAWAPAIRALGRALDGEPTEGLRALADTLHTPDVRAALLAAAALSAEDRGNLEEALDLGLVTSELAPGEPRIAELILRILRRTRRYGELVERLRARAESTPEPEASTAALLERSWLLEYALGDPAEASSTVYSLAAARPDDPVAVFSAVRVALRLADWDRAVEALDRLAECAPADRPRLDLLAGELLLFTLGRDLEAAERFARAESGLPEPLATAARLYGIHAAYERGDRAELERLLQDLAARGPRDIWLPELTETVRAARGIGAMTDLAAAGEQPDGARLLWAIVAGAPGDRGPEGAAAGLVELGRRVGPGAMAGACGAAAMLLGSTATAEGIGSSGADFDSPEALWHATERLRPAIEPGLRAEWAGRRAALLPEEDPFAWADWLLDQAEALEDAGQPAAGLDVIRNGVERLPDHLGLLEAQARLAAASGEFAEAAEAHGRLARSYVSQDEKSTQLARAAAIILDRLRDPAGAEKTLREALRRVPSHAEANSLLERLLHDRGDDGAIVEQLESRIAAEYDSQTLIALYQDQADRLLAMEDTDGALEAIENILLLDQANTPAHRMKIDLLVGASRCKEAIAALNDLALAAGDPVERRISIWRAAELRAAELGDIEGAIEALREHWASGDEHPQTLRLISRLAEQGACWEEAAAALEELATRIPEPVKRAGIVRERARILLEHLFEDEAAEQLLDEVLAVDPTDIKAMEIALQFKDEERAHLMLSRAESGLQEMLDSDPLDLETISRLREISTLLERSGAVDACLDAIAVIGGAGALDRPGADLPAAVADPGRLRVLLLHRDERESPASVVARMAGPLTGEVFAAAEGFPAVPRGAFVERPAADPLATWILGWGAAIGAERIDVARHGEDPRGSVTLPGVTPAVVINPDLALPLDARSRFFLARHVWRAAAGLGAFHEGDAATPLRWVLALASACLGDGAALPLPTDRILVDRARKALSRKLRKALTEPCRALLAVSPQQLRLWTAAISHSADRFGLLVAGDLAGALNWIVEESAGPNGLRRLAENPADTLAKVPRARQLIRFVLSPDYLAARSVAGLEGGGSR